MTQAIRQYLTKKEICELKEFGAIFGAEQWIGVKFNNVDWYFISLEDLDDAGRSFCVSLGSAKRKGLLFDELIKGL